MNFDLSPWWLMKAIVKGAAGDVWAWVKQGNPEYPVRSRHGVDPGPDIADLQADHIREVRLMIRACRDALEPIASNSQEANFAFGHLSHYLLTGEVSIRVTEEVK